MRPAWDGSPKDTAAHPGGEFIFIPVRAIRMTSCYFWLFLVIFGYFWLFLVIFGYFWLFLVIFGLFLVIFGYFWLFLVIFWLFLSYGYGQCD